MPDKTASPIVLADALAIVRHGLAQIVQATLGQTQILQAADGQQALEQLRAWQPCFGVLDEALPLLDGWAVVRAVQQEKIAARLLLLTTASAPPAEMHSQELWGHRYVPKQSSTAEIAAALRVLSRPAETIPFTPQKIVEPAPLLTSAAWDALTPTEQRILRLLAEYKTYPEIAHTLGISYRTVQKHCDNVRQKLQLRGPKALLRFVTGQAEK